MNAAATRGRTRARHSYYGHEEWERDAPGPNTVEDAVEAILSSDDGGGEAERPAPLRLAPTHLAGSDAQGQAKFVASLFQLAA